MANYAGYVEHRNSTIKKAKFEMFGNEEMIGVLGHNSSL